MMKPTVSTRHAEPGSVIRLPCTCANLRRAARLLTQMYNEALAPAGVQITQFTLLQALTLAPDISQKQLGEILGIDSTTLTRTLAGLRRKDWLRSRPGRDRREICLSLTAEGHREYQRVLPYWESAQARLRQALGGGLWRQLVNTSVKVAEIIPSIEKRSTPAPRRPEQVK